MPRPAKVTLDPLLGAVQERSSESAQSEVADVGMPQVFLCREFWMLYALFFVVSGCGLLWLNNIAQIVESASETSDGARDANKSVATALVTLTSIGNLSGRLGVGIVSDRLRHRFVRVFWAQVSCAIMCATYSCLYFFADLFWMLFPGAFMLGLAFGVLFTTVIASTADLYGTRYLSGNYCFLDSAPILGSLLFSVYVFGHRYSDEGHAEGDGDHCWGKECYRASFLVAAAASLVGFVLAFLLWRSVQNAKTRRLTQEKDQLFLSQN